MWTTTLDLEPRKVLLTKLLGFFYRDAYYSSFSPLQVENVPRPSLPDTGWVRVRNRLAGICGSDLHLVHLDGDPRIAPAAIPNHKHIYPGHEVVGEVIEIGDDVQKLHVGDRVVLQHGPNCLSNGVSSPCRSCAGGNYNLCEQSRLPGPQPIGGGWSEEMLLHEQQLFALPPGVSDEQAVMLEPSAVALHAILRHLPQPGDRVLIIGAGTIGLLVLQLLRTLAPQAEVSVLARHAFQVEQATRMGAAHIIYPQDAYTGVQRATKAQLFRGPLNNRMLTGGYDVIYDTVGSRSTLHHALRWLRAQATLVLVGINLHLMHIDLSPLWYLEVNLIGATSHGVESWPPENGEQRSTFSVATELIEQGQLQPEQLITHHFALNAFKDALITATNKARSRAIKVVFDYSLLPASVVPNVRASARRPATIGAAPTRFKESVQEQEDSTASNEGGPVQPFAIQVTPPVQALAGRNFRPTTSDIDDENEDTVPGLPIVTLQTRPVPQTPAVNLQRITMHDHEEIIGAVPIAQSHENAGTALNVSTPSLSTHETLPALTQYTAQAAASYENVESAQPQTADSLVEPRLFSTEQTHVETGEAVEPAMITQPASEMIAPASDAQSSATPFEQAAPDQPEPEMPMHAPVEPSTIEESMPTPVEPSATEVMKASSDLAVQPLEVDAAAKDVVGPGDENEGIQGQNKEDNETAAETTRIIKTNDEVSSLPYVEEPPTVRFQPRTRSRKKKS